MKEERPIEVEVLPPEREKSKDPFLELIATLMDQAFTIPGTKIRFGLDPILGLLPGFGDTMTGLISVLTLAQSARRGVPRIVIARMALNIAINTIIGAIPVLGDAFSLWFKSNVRNYELLKKHFEYPRLSTKTDWFFVIGIIIALLAVLFLAVGAIVALISTLIKAL